MRGQAPISPIYRMAPRPPQDPDVTFARVWRLCRNLWAEAGTIAVRPDELPEELREPLVAWAEDTYGERPKSRKSP